MALLDRRAETRGERSWFDRFPFNLLRLGRSGGGRAFGPLTVWIWWERFTNWRGQVRPIGTDAFLLFGFSHFGENERTLADGTVLRKGDTIIELHFNNPLLTQWIAEGSFTPWKVLRSSNRDITTLAQRVVHGDLSEARAMHGITLFAATGPRLGMEIHTLPRSFQWALVRYFMIGLIALYHPLGWKHAAKTCENLWPAELWIGLETIKRRVAKLDVPERSLPMADKHGSD